MSKQLKTKDIIALGFMVFALFLGAGNLIFPPVLGQQVATNDLFYISAGFLSSAVGLPLLTLFVTAKLDGGLECYTKYLPKWAATLFGITLYLAIGPLFAIPRTAVVSYEMTLRPIFQLYDLQPIFSLVFFGICLYFTLNPSKLVDSIGKLVTPALIFVLLLMSVAVIMHYYTLDTISVPNNQGDDFSPTFFGFLQGYQTMDALAAMAFSIVIVSSLKSRGITETKLRARYALIASIIAALGLALVYIMLIALGATSHSITDVDSNGAVILMQYMSAVFGIFGDVIIGLAVTLACLTTAIGLITACGDYFHELYPKLSYRSIVIVCSILSIIISNIGLTHLLAITLPTLVIIYPVAIVLVCLSLIREYLTYPKYSFTFSATPVLIISVLESIKQADFYDITVLENTLAPLLNALPFSSVGMSWVLVAIIGAIVGGLFGNILKQYTASNLN